MGRSKGHQKDIKKRCGKSASKKVGSEEAQVPENIPGLRQEGGKGEGKPPPGGRNEEREKGRNKKMKKGRSKEGKVGRKAGVYALVLVGRRT